ncbi:MAG: peptide ABC transporter substrate-binding protein [Opitutales bacterium]|jgi:oligopeptide transport system substrate-binding protein|nr:peptide ABC transporter substrate-binding protein [Opitutales bacterium]MDP4645149.1 peptide ABC transporter substrate-binding protein [Opitutales bacterium]MDP4778436.1 peptide ABC transporter substrate-binding protein [Opitutales bacterium]MDP4884472.1 peptide ABC transporter substrate-binding protein [Opitutales bacterium]MDP5080760.1 peptide ABC transporter substrate-binding protein [Opitutales bacterium]
MHRRYFITTLCLSCLLWMTVGCTKKKTNVELGNTTQELYLGIGAEPATLDPHLSTGLTEYSIMMAFLEGLTTLDAETMRVLPGVAKSWDISEDGLLYTFHFDPNACWSNGDRVTPEDFLFSFERILTPLLGAPYAYMLYPMRDAEAFHTGKLTDFSKVGATAIDDHTLQIELEQATPYFLSLLAHNTWFPVHPPTILKHGSMTERISKWTKAGNYVGNGPYLLKKWRLNTEVYAVKNPHFRDIESVNLNGIHFLPIEIDTEERAFRSGHLHITATVPIHRIDWYREHRPETINFATSLGVYYYMLNTSRGPLADPRVRKALAYTINREELTKHVLKAGQQPAYHFTPPNAGGYNAEARFPYDPDLARQLLAEAGFPDGKGFPAFELLYNTSESHRTIAVAIQQMWKKELGINIELHNQEWKAYLSTREAGEFDILRASWFGDYDDPNTFLSLGETNNGNNHTEWSSPEYDALIKQAAVTLDPEARKAIFQKAEAILLDEMPVIPIYFYVTSRLIDDAVQGWYPSILDNHPYQAIKLIDNE